MSSDSDELTSAKQVLKMISDFRGNCQSAGVTLSLKEEETLEAVKRDAVHDIIHLKDRALFEEMEWLKKVELDYLHQVSGVRQVYPSVVFGDGYRGYGNGWSGSRICLMYPQDRKRANRESKELLLPQPILKETALMKELLVPIRIELDNGKIQLCDTFVWNALDRSVPIEIFSQNLLEDFALPLSLTEQVSRSIQDQLNVFCPHRWPAACLPVDAPENVMTDAKTENSQLRTAGGRHAASYAPKDKRMDDANEAFSETTTTLLDMRVTIKIDLTVGQHTLVDQFEWDINCPENNPEEFAELTCRELSLPNEFATAIAHSIREQSQQYTRLLWGCGYEFDGKEVEDKEIRAELASPVLETSFLRPQELLSLYTPVLNQNIKTEAETHEIDVDSRKRRRQGRSSRRMGVAAAGSCVQAPMNANSVAELKQIVHNSNTPIYSSTLPGGLHYNLDVLHMTMHNIEDEMTKNDLMHYFHRMRNARHIPSDSLFDLSMIKPKLQFIVKLKIPKRSSFY